jgi:hypothetical protein
MSDLQIDTPLGSIGFSAFAGGTPISELSPRIARCKVVRSLPELTLPNGMSVAGCAAVLLQCEAALAIPSLLFESKWDDCAATVWQPESGEYLAAQSWTNGRSLVMVGTEDEESLQERATRGSHMPRSMAGQLGDPSVVSYGSDGFVVCLPPVPERSRIGLHYVVAWNPDPEPVEASAWYAVDIPHAKIVEAASEG